MSKVGQKEQKKKLSFTVGKHFLTLVWCSDRNDNTVVDPRELYEASDHLFLIPRREVRPFKRTTTTTTTTTNNVYFSNSSEDTRKIQKKYTRRKTNNCEQK